jgi:hypothetical protein
MDYELFITSLEKTTPPADLPLALLSLWHDAQGNWDIAHETIQNEPGETCAWIHAYLHRKEGDLWNARYWYNKCGRSEFKGSLSEEWERIVRSLVEERKAA